MIKKLSIMTQEQKDLLLKDLCGRLPYGVKAKVLVEDILRYDYSSEEGGFINGIENINNGLFVIQCREDSYVLSYDEFKPYLRPMSSMTEEQKADMIKSSCGIGSDKNVFDWFNKNHFDYRGLIEKGIALDATGLNIY